MVDLRHLQPLAQKALLQLVDALNEVFPLPIGERIAEHNADVVRHAEIRLNRCRPADRALGLKCSDAREIRHAHTDRRIYNQRLVVDEAKPAAADVDEGNLADSFTSMDIGIGTRTKSRSWMRSALFGRSRYQMVSGSAEAER